jgi:hypothetical protein
LAPGKGIEDPHVWAVKKCQQLQAQMLQRAPGGKFPPIFQDLALMQVSSSSSRSAARTTCLMSAVCAFSCQCHDDAMILQ